MEKQLELRRENKVVGLDSCIGIARRPSNSYRLLLQIYEEIRKCPSRSRLVLNASEDRFQFHK